MESFIIWWNRQNILIIEHMVLPITKIKHWPLDVTIQVNVMSKRNCWTWKRFNGLMDLIIRLQSKFWKYYLTYLIYLFSRIMYYSATHTSNAAYIIGGFYSQNIIAEFQNGQWRRLDDLNTGRYVHGSITSGSQTMIIGGVANSE